MGAGLAAPFTLANTPVVSHPVGRHAPLGLGSSTVPSARAHAHTRRQCSMAGAPARPHATVVLPLPDNYSRSHARMQALLARLARVRVALARPCSTRVAPHTAAEGPCLWSASAHTARPWPAEPWPRGVPPLHWTAIKRRHHHLILSYHTSSQYVAS